MTRPVSRRVAPERRTARTTPVGGRSEHAATQALTWRDPARMTPAERLAEVGSILAAGHARQLENFANGLACGGQPERACEAEAFDSLENRSKHA